MFSRLIARVGVGNVFHLLCLTITALFLVGAIPELNPTKYTSDCLFGAFLVIPFVISFCLTEDTGIRRL